MLLILKFWLGSLGCCLLIIGCAYLAHLLASRICELPAVRRRGVEKRTFRAQRNITWAVRNER